MSTAKVLVVDDDALMLEMCQDILEALQFESITVQDSTTAIDVITSKKSSRQCR